ncbi:MAG: IS5 family transposase [Alphaproteobacteria bacterium]|nr:IS5 family transposase [Alphaproteobacteria bacterium]
MGGCVLRPDRLERRDRSGGGRFDPRQGTPLGGWRKRGGFRNAIGRSRGGRTTKVHALTDQHGRPVAFALTPGNVHDLVGAATMLERIPTPAKLLADRAYDARKLRDWLTARGCEPVIPPNPTRKHPHTYDRSAYKARNLIERMFCRLKDFRRVATRYDKRADTFLAAVLIAATLIWWLN